MGKGIFPNRFYWAYELLGLVDLPLTPALSAVNVDMFAQYIFSRISRRAIDARKFDVIENIFIIGA